MAVRCQNRPDGRWHGFTLVEVVAALVILGVLLALIVKASTQSNRQFALAQQRLFAAEAADRIVAGWFADGTPIQPGLRGEIRDTPLWWETVAREDAQLRPLGAAVVQLRVYARPATGDKDTARPAAAEPALLLTLDLLTSKLPPALASDADLGATSQPTTQPGAATRPSDDPREDPRLREAPAFMHQR
jgi:prepilin-type N-terminal cleavage/methylation domain-containing protein